MIGWIDAASGASGDMLLGALVDAGAGEQRILSAVRQVAPEAVTVETSQVRRAGLAARLAAVTVADSSTHRGLGAVIALIREAGVDPDVERHAIAVFTRLAEAEAAVHGGTVDEVHFHEVGALDAIVDVVGACAGFVELGLEELHCSPVAVGSGTVSTGHGRLSVPPPAVVALLTGAPTYAGQVAREMCTPTGAALLAHWVTHWGPQPPMVVRATGIGAGSRDLSDQPNVLRLLLGEPVSVAAPAPARTTAVVFETNVDDLDPRLWPHVLARLLEAGASDAWLTPILMKKGRLAHTLSVLARPEFAEQIRRVVFVETSAIGMREHPIRKHELDRAFETVQIEGRAVRIKVARLSDGTVVNRQPEYADVIAVAAALGRSAKSVLAEAIARAAGGPAD